MRAAGAMIHCEANLRSAWLYIGMLPYSTVASEGLQGSHTKKTKKVVLLVVAVTGHGNVPSYAAYLVDNSCVHLSSLCSSQPTFADMLPRLKPFSDKTCHLVPPCYPNIGMRQDCRRFREERK